MLKIIGTGLEKGGITQEAWEALLSAEKIVLHTGRNELAGELDRRGIPYETLDALYDSSDDFDGHVLSAADAVERAAGRYDTVYAVFDLRDRTVHELLRRGLDPLLIPGTASDAMLTAFETDHATFSAAAADVDEDTPFSPFADTIIREIDDRMLAGNVKLQLMEIYPEECEIRILHRGKLFLSTLTELDRQKEYDHTFSVFIPAVESLTELKRFDADCLRRIVHRLMEPDGCPWDRAQTHETLKQGTIEEAYEVAEAIENGDDEAFCDELGDLSLQSVMQAEIAARHGEFTLKDVMTAICSKMIRRHPFVFGNEGAVDEETAKDIWDRVKQSEKKDAGRVKGVARTLPGLIRAGKLLGRAEDGTPEEAILKNINAALEQRDVGRLLFETARLAHNMNVDPEEALKGACDAYQNTYGNDDISNS